MSPLAYWISDAYTHASLPACPGTSISTHSLFGDLPTALAVSLAFSTPTAWDVSDAETCRLSGFGPGLSTMGFAGVEVAPTGVPACAAVVAFGANVTPSSRA